MSERVTRLAGLAGVALLIAGCTLGRLPMLGDIDDEIPLPSLRATYTHGTASISVTRDGGTETITLDRVGPGSHLMTEFGASATWRGAGGWVLQLSAFDMAFDLPGPLESAAEGPGGYSGDVVIQHISGQELWRADSFSESGNRCIVDLDSVSESALSGTATCRGLRWVDGFAMPAFANPAYVDGQPAFDSEITFEARP